MGEDNTPPASPSNEIMDMLEPDEDELVEVIDLDENEPIDDDDNDDENNVEGAASQDVIPEEVHDNSDLVFKEHTDAVFCVDIQPDSEDPLVASGGQDDTCYLWNLKSGKVMKKLDNFKDSVVHVKFNFNGTYLAVADMAGTIYVLKTLPNITQEPVWSFETGDITWLDWHPGANVLFAGTEDSSLWMWKIPSGHSKIFQGNGEKVESAQVLPDGRRVVVGYSDGSIRVFDLKSEEVLHSASIFDSKASIVSLDVRSDNTLVALGNVDGEVKIFNVQSGKVVAHFQNSAKKSKIDEDYNQEEANNEAIESVLFSTPEGNQVITGNLDGMLSVWDLSSQVSKLCTKVGTGLVKLKWLKTSLILAATLDGLIRIIDPRSGNVIEDCSGHTQQILDFSISKCGQYLVSTSDDHSCRVYEIEKLLK